jgi:hypothetical protein
VQPPTQPAPFTPERNNPHRRQLRTLPKSHRLGPGSRRLLLLVCHGRSGQCCGCLEACGVLLGWRYDAPPLGYAIDRGLCERCQTLSQQYRHRGQGQRSAEGSCRCSPRSRQRLTKDYAGGRPLGNNQMLGFRRGQM